MMIMGAEGNEPRWLRNVRDFLNGVPLEVPEQTATSVTPDAELTTEARWLKAWVEAQAEQEQSTSS